MAGAIRRYRPKRPREVEAAPVGVGISWDDLAAWCGGRVERDHVDKRRKVIVLVRYPGTVDEHQIRARRGDWLVNLAPDAPSPYWVICSGETFANSYEPVL